VNSSASLLRHGPGNDALISRYQQLREQALGRPSQIPRGQGLALLMRSGMRAWMQAWAQCTVQLPAAPQQRLGGEKTFPLEMHQEVAMILAGMVLHPRQEATA
jgi:hypothetical protein